MTGLAVCLIVWLALMSLSHIANWFDDEEPYRVFNVIINIGFIIAISIVML